MWQIGERPVFNNNALFHERKRARRVLTVVAKSKSGEIATRLFRIRKNREELRIRIFESQAFQLVALYARGGIMQDKSTEELVGYADAHHAPLFSYAIGFVHDDTWREVDDATAHNVFHSVTCDFMSMQSVC